MHPGSVTAGGPWRRRESLMVRDLQRTLILYKPGRQFCSRRNLPLRRGSARLNLCGRLGAELTSRLRSGTAHLVGLCLEPTTALPHSTSLLGLGSCATMKPLFQRVRV